MTAISSGGQGKRRKREGTCHREHATATAAATCTAATVVAHLSSRRGHGERVSVEGACDRGVTGGCNGAPMPCSLATSLIPSHVSIPPHPMAAAAQAEPHVLLLPAAAAAAGGGGGVVAQPAPAAPPTPMLTLLDRIRAHLLAVARLLQQGGDAVAARALAHRIARSVAGQHGVNKVVSAEASTQTVGSALLYVNWDESNAHAMCAAVASELLAEQDMGTAPTAAQLRRAQASALAFHRLVQNMKTSLGWNYLANLLGYSGGKTDDDAQLDACVGHACLALCHSDAGCSACCGEDDDEDSMADSTDEQSVSAEETVRQRQWGSSDSESSASHRAADVQLAVWGLACKPL